jgi:glycine oxidase
MSHKVSSCEVLVAGGGIIGAACARALALRGLKVAICEPGPDPAAASAASAGILGPQIEATDESLRALGLRARDLYDTLAVALADTTGIDIGLWREGIASLAFEDAEAERLRDAVAHQRQAGLRCDWLEAADAAELFPAAAPCLGAMFAPEDGAVDAPALTRALRADAKRLGARTFATRVNRINTILGRVTGVEIPAGKIRAEHVVIAAGAWSTQINHLPRHLPVEPVRGQMAAAPWPDNMPRTVLYYDHAYVLARSGDGASRLRRQRHGGGNRRDHGVGTAHPPQPPGRTNTHLGWSAASHAGRSSHRWTGPRRAGALVCHRSRTQRRAARRSHWRDHRQPRGDG